MVPVLFGRAVFSYNHVDQTKRIIRVRTCDRSGRIAVVFPSASNDNLIDAQLLARSIPDPESDRILEKLSRQATRNREAAR